jgi:hypothetical protein
MGTILIKPAPKGFTQYKNCSHSFFQSFFPMRCCRYPLNTRVEYPKEKRWQWAFEKCNACGQLFQGPGFIKTGLYTMGILVIVIIIISESFQVIICHRLIFYIFFWLSMLHFSMFLFVCSFFFLYVFNIFFKKINFVVNFFNESDFYWHFDHQIKNVKKY